jgi:hypothetical protein
MRDFYFGSLEGDETINLEDFFAAEKLAVIVKSEAAKTFKTDTNLEQFNCNLNNCKHSPEKGLTQHIQMKHCHSVDFNCIKTGPCSSLL